jgi:hypothetical protein
LDGWLCVGMVVSVLGWLLVVSVLG